MNIGLWVVQGLLAAAFLGAGAMKAFSPVSDLAAEMAWAADSPVWVVRLAGISELLGALGLILPSATRIKPMLSVFAAEGLATVMILAAGLHIYRGEYGMILGPLVLLALCVFVTYGRYKLVPIADRSAAS